jgi:hypothetical protein
MSPKGDAVEPVFGTLFDGEDLPQDGKAKPSDRPGFGMTLRGEVALKRPYEPKPLRRTGRPSVVKRQPATSRRPCRSEKFVVHDEFPHPLDQI